MTGSLLLPLSYLALAVFAVAFLYRAVRMAMLPVHLRWELAPVPHEGGERGKYGGSYLEDFEWWTKKREKSLASEAFFMGQEIFLLKGVWEHQRSLWWSSFPFHIGLYFLVAELGLAVLGAFLGVLGVDIGSILTPLIVLCGAAGCILGTIGAVGLILTRLTHPKYKDYTSPAAFFNLFLLLAIFVTGGLAVLTTEYYAGYVAGVPYAMMTVSTSWQIPGLLSAHVLLTLFFLAYFPFTQMMHFVAKYFLYHKVRWDDQPMPESKALEAQVKQLLGQPVTWAAPHLNADGKKNWVDIATEETRK
ncbi:MAG: respiratory nitrate reductase subunit gamma [Planctomycetota bacterium]|jgi:nitrate reductase gamma subunit